jgi:preprotein translocase subunit SecG
MNWLNTAFMVFHVLLAAGIVGLVLLQRGKGAEAGAGFGAGASGTVFGARGSASFLSRTTAALALLFFITSLALAFLGGRHSAPTSVVDRLAPPALSPAPAKDKVMSEVPSAPAEPPNPAPATGAAGAPATSHTEPAKN